MSSGKPVDLNCPAWCVTNHAEDGEVRHYSDISAVPLSRLPFMTPQGLCNTAMLATLNQEPYESAPLVALVCPSEDGRTELEVEPKLTVDEAEHLAKTLLELVDVARSYDQRNDAAKSAFYAGHLAGRQGADVTAQWQSYAKWKAERDVE